MPTESFYDTFPPFPDGLHVLDLPKLSYQKLLCQDSNETAALYDASIEHGFFLLDLSGAAGGPQLLRDIIKVFGIGKSFFDAGLEEKKEFKVNSSNVGYKPMGVFKYRDGRSDLTEICAVSRDSILGDSPIPKQFADERTFLSTVCDRLHPVAITILDGLATHLDINPETLRKFHDPADTSATVLRFIHNPPQKQEPYAALMGHTDSGSVTVLFAGMGGLQILPSNLQDTAENWKWVRPEPNCAIINIGDPLVQWSGEILRSSFHRVFHAPGQQAPCERYSFGYFLKPSDHAPMQRVQEGNVIPILTPSEAEEDVEVEIYDLWHRNKTRGIMKGDNNVKSRGGLGFRLRAQASEIAT